MTTPMTTIYGLCDPGTDAVRYVGATAGPLGRRVTQHRAAIKQRDQAVTRWMRSIGGRPEAVVIATVVYEKGPAAERFAIALLRASGSSLVNEADGGRGPNGFRHPSERGLKQRAYRIGRKWSVATRAKMSRTRATWWAKKEVA